MRSKLIKLLRMYDRVAFFENEYHDAIGDEQFDYLVKELISFPNYRTIGRLFRDNYLPAWSNMVPEPPMNSIIAELKRMKSDGFVTIGTQNGQRTALTDNIGEPDYESHSFATESIILTTKGRSGWRYLFYQAQENPFNIIALLISILALIVSVSK